ncbi:hypothetical protein [Xanthomonas arboricola]|uniref:Uncharacterized protein n=1 Tax=Xanthomonas arboricola TaxID=56448 RepID=A0A2S7AHX3_9XANT|nr:hypothetical protein [Xanthomonas arboricola]PPU09467.1 hypothetical protein XarjCFBP7645_04030 [Xanthomonas arboricola]
MGNASNALGDGTNAFGGGSLALERGAAAIGRNASPAGESATAIGAGRGLAQRRGQGLSTCTGKGRGGPATRRIVNVGGGAIASANGAPVIRHTAARGDADVGFLAQ